MKTVKEVSELTGISVRTLHYYDEIGLFKPTEVNEAGYRLYDDKAIDKLGQILVFKELDIPLADIKHIMENPGLDSSSVLAKQRKMLCLKKQRIERIIAGIDEMLKGDNMDFKVFDETELQDMFSDMLENMSESQQQIFIDQYGSAENWKKHLLESASDEKVQKNYAKLVMVWRQGCGERKHEKCTQIRSFCFLSKAHGRHSTKNCRHERNRC